MMRISIPRRFCYSDSNAAIPFATQFFQDEGDDIPDFEEEFDNPVGALGPLAEGDAPAQDAANMTAAADEDDLIAATQNLNTRVRPEFVSYAKKAKRVDVKKLKENIWRELEDLTKDLQAEPSVCCIHSHITQVRQRRTEHTLYR